ncbi:MAG: hypothetical protein LC649_01345 [Bacteroidales bacterium]|nr:hypothetical protein [Bacteroidales bacterium]
MQNIEINLYEKEFSKGRKILLLVFGSVLLATGLYNVALKVLKYDYLPSPGLTITTLSLGTLILLTAFFATSKRKNFFFRINSDILEYRYGLLVAKEGKFQWNDISKIYMPPKEKSFSLESNTGKITGINLNWIEGSKAITIRKNIYYAARQLNKDIVKGKPKRK